MRYAVLFSAAMLTFPLQLALTGWTADWLLARYGSTPAWAMWFFIGLETSAATYLINRVYTTIDVIQKFAKFYFERREIDDAVVLKIYGIKIVQLKGARPESDSAELPESSPRTYTYAEFSVVNVSSKASEKSFLRFIRAPVLETVIDQVLIILLMRWIGFEMEAQIAVSAFLFVWCHFKNASPRSGFCSISGGLYYGFTCAHWIRTSLWTSFWVTAAAHALHNILGNFAYSWLISFIRKLFAKRTDG